MSMPMWAAATSRKIRKRICIEGDLVLLTPACLGNGDTDETVDMPLLVDPGDGRTPLLTGASLAGALRSYLREWEHGYAMPAKPTSHTVALFGANRGDDDGLQSAIILDDAYGEGAGLESRHEVGLASASRTSAQDKLFNRHLWTAGTRFPIRFELIVSAGDDETGLKRALATAVTGLQNGEIALGARKRRGYGLVTVDDWRVRCYDLSLHDDLIAWLRDGTAGSGAISRDLAKTLGVPLLDDERRRFDLSATLGIDGTLLMAGDAATDGPDKVHIRSRRRNGDSPPVLPGTGLAGALRARALGIARTLTNGSNSASELVDSIFGPAEIKSGSRSFASRLEVYESDILNDGPDWVQFRIRTDRLTAGVIPGGLFNAQPVTGGQVSVQLRLRNPEPSQTGLLLLLLKDLWTRDLPIGGETGVGRGRLRGIRAGLAFREPGTERSWEIREDGNGNLQMTGDDKDILESYVSTHLNAWAEDAKEETRHVA